jgi:hypothetical protein
MKLFIFGLLCLTSAAQATAVIDAAPTTSLIGATVGVTHVPGGGAASAVFVAGPAGSVIAESLGSAGFRLEVSASADTRLATWTLTNTDLGGSARSIASLSIDLTATSMALFDTGSEPSTPGSLGGVAGVIPTPPIIAGLFTATEVSPWSDTLNAGDMFTATNFTFALGGLAPGAATTWQDDTDAFAVPEPASAGLLAAGLGIVVAVALRRRRSA